VAAARLGAKVTLVARLGRDLFGDQALAGFEAEGINTAYIVRDADEVSGMGACHQTMCARQNPRSKKPMVCC
jgi:sugar/nucleoside kinase (ribokinase family)